MAGEGKLGVILRSGWGGRHGREWFNLGLEEEVVLEQHGLHASIPTTVTSYGITRDTSITPAHPLMFSQEVKKKKKKIVLFQSASLKCVCVSFITRNIYRISNIR